MQLHVTGNELAAGSLAVAALAVVTSWATSRAASQSQERLAHEQWLRDRLAETYAGLLAGVHLRGAALDRLFHNHPSRGQPDYVDVASDRETTLAAQLLAYGSPRVYELFSAFDEESAKFCDLLRQMRDAAGSSPATIPGAGSGQSGRDLREQHESWHRAKGDVVDGVRAELHPGGGRLYLEPMELRFDPLGR